MTYTVTTTADQSDASSSGGWSLRDAVMASNADANPSNVISLPAGTYMLTLGTAETNVTPNAAVSSAGDIDIIKDLTIEGAGAAATIIDGGDIDRIFDIHGVSVTIRNVTLGNGNSIGAGTPYGGAVYMRGTNSAGTGIGNKELRLENCSVFGNSANHSGGAISVNGWTGQTPNRLVMDNCVLESNSALYGGGALVVNATASATVTNCTFRNNASNGATIGWGGGAISSLPGTAAGAFTSVSNCTFSNNSALLSGGAIVHHNGPLSVTQCAFTGNNAQVNGGAIGRSASDQTAQINVTGCSFASNQADSDNNTVGDGGAIFNRGPASTANVSFCRLVGNTAVSGTQLANADSAGAFNAPNNWWGSNSGQSGTMVRGALTSTPHLQLTLSVSPTVVRPGQSATLTASLNKNSDGQLVGGSGVNYVPNTTELSWSASEGSIAPAAPLTFSSGQAQATFTGAANYNLRNASVTVDGHIVPLNIEAPVAMSAFSAE